MVARCRKFVGAVGDVAQAKARVVRDPLSLFSFDWNLTGVVGVTPATAGRPIPITVAGAVAIVVLKFRTRQPFPPFKTVAAMISNNA